jgi:pyruvate,water dikinase
MGRIADLIKHMMTKGRESDAENVEALRTAFKARYHQFKLLLNANNKALDIMAEMEEALKGARPFGMRFVFSRSTAASTSVWQMLHNLNQLAPGKYEALYGRFKEIQKQINPFIRPKRPLKEGPLVISLGQVDRGMTDLVGGKIANLGEVKNRMRLRVPNGFAITAAAYERFMKHNDLQAEIDRRIQSADADRLDSLYTLSADIQHLMIRSPLPEDLESAIREAYAALRDEEGSGVTVAMRSSALGEDDLGTSFAGQYRTELNVSRENIIQAYKEILASKYGLPAMTYRFRRGIRDEDVAMCVGCMAMVDALSSGVLYTRNPMNFRDRRIIINAAWGLPKTIVDGSAASDQFILSWGDPVEIIHKEIPFKEQEFICYPEEGVCRLEMTRERGQSPSITDEQARDLARIGMELDEYYRAGRDIEWAVTEGGTIVILQCRELQSSAAPPDPSQEAERKTIETPPLLTGGVRASPGVAAGPVYVLKKDIDALRCPEGAVLVAAQSLPRWATLLGRAAAVVTEKGSIAGHLANVAREFGVPALFGVDRALERLTPGREVTVDADGLKVFDGRLEQVLPPVEAPRNIMKGSPVYEALQGAARHIVPLNLLDPDAPSFNPKSCRTFHDITRFCHEKSVQEMFRFGKDHDFPERSSKQLVCEVPMQWWVLNLDDGFREEVKGRYVNIGNIVSVPMLALWKGIRAFPWEGPPPMDGKGLLSVMFQATRNTALVPGLRSKYANRNYFMISKNYCSLTSRLGFHFSIVEALVSERPRENYISFQFKGGAADDERRQRRIGFIGDILEENGFRVEARKDHLLARLEDREKAEMERSLSILGYLTIHTRQLDMIMANTASVNYYRSRILKQIRELLRMDSRENSGLPVEAGEDPLDAGMP